MGETLRGRGTTEPKLLPIKFYSVPVCLIYYCIKYPIWESDWQLYFLHISWHSAFSWQKIGIPLPSKLSPFFFQSLSERKHHSPEFFISLFSKGATSYFSMHHRKWCQPQMEHKYPARSFSSPENGEQPKEQIRDWRACCCHRNQVTSDLTSWFCSRSSESQFPGLRREDLASPSWCSRWNWLCGVFCCLGF